MKRVIAVIIVLFFLAVGYAYADVYMTKKTGDLTVTASLVNQPPVTGKNDLTIRIEDRAGKPVKGADVELKYYMTAQRQSTQMPYMEKKTKATPIDSLYKATLDLDMKGRWYVDVNISRDGQKDSVTFHFHVD